MAELKIKTLRPFTTQMVLNSNPAVLIEHGSVDVEFISIEGEFKPVATGHMLSFEADLSFGTSSHPFKVVAKLVQEEVLSDNKRRLILKLQEYDHHLWQNYLRDLAKAQDRVNSIFKKYIGLDE